MSDVLAELMAREPLFHHRELVHDAASFDREAGDDFWEVGASGRVYSREEVRDVVLSRLGDPEPREVEGWRTESPAVREVGPDAHVLTYVLHGQGRVTRRMTLWRHDHERGWHALYHQGTVVQEP